MKVLRQIIRGCGDLPHVGPHPGTFLLGIFCIFGMVAGANKGFSGSIVGALFMGGFMAPMYLSGAYDRAQLSDRLSKDPTK